tara:strand:- start:38 stop:241 length:204 start_codon:yes stop_codon:yes gene_type:complete
VFTIQLVVAVEKLVQREGLQQQLVVLVQVQLMHVMQQLTQEVVLAQDHLVLIHQLQHMEAEMVLQEE